jgi:hypothetical protein
MAYNGYALKHSTGQGWLSMYHGGDNPAATSQTFTAGRVLMCEFIVEQAVSVDAISYIAGAVQAGNITVGICGPIATRETSTGAAVLVQSDSTAQGAINTPQTVTFAATVLQPGLYYACLEGSDATGTYMRQSNTTQVAGFGAYYDRDGGYGALTNPAPATTNTGSALPALRVRFG